MLKNPVVNESCFSENLVSSLFKIGGGVASNIQGATQGRRQQTRNNLYAKFGVSSNPDTPQNQQNQQNTGANNNTVYIITGLIVLVIIVIFIKKFKK
jgi:LPXTG-motif cell wall-anchored protein